MGKRKDNQIIIVGVVMVVVGGDKSEIKGMGIMEKIMWVMKMIHTIFDEIIFFNQ